MREIQESDRVNKRDTLFGLKAVEKIREALRDWGKTSNTARGLDRQSIKLARRLEQRAIRNISLQAPNKWYDSIVVLCIGTSLSEFSADNLGPLVGSMLQKSAPIEKVHVYGTMQKPLDGRTLKRSLNEIFRRHEKPFVIGIDCAIGFDKDRIGIISINNNSLKPGSGIDKDLPEVGNMNITATLVHRKKDDSIEDLERKLGETDREYVEDIAKIISVGTYNALKKVTEKEFFKK